VKPDYIPGLHNRGFER